jgi:hypothetical protein
VTSPYRSERRGHYAACLHAIAYAFIGSLVDSHVEPVPPGDERPRADPKVVCLVRAADDETTIPVSIVVLELTTIGITLHMTWMDR